MKRGIKRKGRVSDYMSFSVFLRIFWNELFTTCGKCGKIKQSRKEVFMARKKSKVQKSAEKAVKKTHTATIVLAILFLLIGAAVGIFVSM